MGTHIVLTWQELRTAAGCGVSRRIVSLHQGNNAHVHTRHSGWNTDIDGAAAELAAAKALGLYWSPSINTFKAPDVGEIQVRSTNHQRGHLLVRPNDSDEAVFLFLRGAYQHWDLVGMIRAREAKQPQFWRDGSDGEAGCWWVPDHALHPVCDGMSLSM